MVKSVSRFGFSKVKYTESAIYRLTSAWLVIPEGIITKAQRNKAVAIEEEAQAVLLVVSVVKEEKEAIAMTIVAEQEEAEKDN
jgi:hypothetical protein